MEVGMEKDTSSDEDEDNEEEMDHNNDIEVEHTADQACITEQAETDKVDEVSYNLSHISAW